MAGVETAPESAAPIVAERSRRALADGGYLGPIEALERFAFYDRGRQAYAIVATGELRLYGNLILRKGVIRPSEDAAS